MAIFPQLIRLCSVLVFATLSNAFLALRSKVSNLRQTSIFMSFNDQESLKWDLIKLTRIAKRALIAPLVFTLGQLPMSWIPLSQPSSAYAVEDISTRVLRTEKDSESKQVEVYFGVGCFWHVQHEFVGKFQ